jgi:predicted O-methyltransferase YrrM
VAEITDACIPHRLCARLAAHGAAALGVKMAAQLGNMLSRLFRRPTEQSSELEQLVHLPRIEISTNQLRPLSASDLARAFNDEGYSSEWAELSVKTDSIQPIPDMKTGGVNPGDRRAIYHLIRYLRPKRILEIGTHVCASTMSIAAALKRNGDDGRLVTVDITDVINSPDAYWKRYGLRLSPFEAMKSIGSHEFVEFRMMSSFDYFSQNDFKFDFIFLDGDHAATTVYQEIPAALQALQFNGSILLHDLFPDHQPLWSGQPVIHGPIMACERFIQEGAKLNIIPLGHLPWPTKLGSNITSLAIVTR